MSVKRESTVYCLGLCHLVPVVQKVDNAINWISLYSLDSANSFPWIVLPAFDLHSWEFLGIHFARVGPFFCLRYKESGVPLIYLL